MVEFNELRIDSEGTTLYIDVSVPSSYEDCFIERIYVDGGIPLGGDCPSYSNKKSLVATTHREEVVEGKTALIVDTTAVRLELKEENLANPVSFNRDMLHIFVELSKVEEGNCSFPMRTVINIYPVYQRAMYYVKELGQSCLVPRRFEDLILKLKAVDMAVQTGNYLIAHKMWNEMFRIHGDPVTPKPCGCGTV